MKKLLAIGVIAGLLVGVLVGFLWWGIGAQRPLNEAQGRVLAAQAELKGAQAQLKAKEEELRMERDRRQKLEAIVSQGRK
jgi:uncharacterized membrane-anchored protein YhcB (DUF1043 family)